MKFFNWSRFLMDAAGDDGKGAGGGGKDDKSAATDQTKLIADLTAKLEAIEKKFSTTTTTKTDDTDLASKAEADRLAKAKASTDSKKMENALKFTMSSGEWFKTNASLLPKSIEGILQQADKENYENAVEKDSAIKVGLISEFFSLQANLDLLTESQKSIVENFKKLTKTDKQDKAAELYDSLFEPTFEMLKRIKKAEQLGQGHSVHTDAEAAYKDKLIKGSKKHYLGEKT